jgi:hypothetical protein
MSFAASSTWGIGHAEQRHYSVPEWEEGAPTPKYAENRGTCTDGYGECKQRRYREGGALS